jgi:hypothetical protein
MATLSVQSMTHGLGARTRDWFLPRRHGRSLSDDQAKLVRSFVERGEARARLAGDDDSPEGASISVGLLRDAALSLLHAADLANRELANATAPADALALLERSGLRQVMPARDADLVDRALRESEPLAFDHWPAQELAAVGPALQDLIRRARARIDLRSDAHLRGLGVVRLGAVGLLVVCGLFLAGRRLFALENVARGRPVQASSHYPGTPDPSGLTDGIKGGSAGIHTLVGQPGLPWAVVDLGQPRDIRKIVVYNRGDSYFDDGLPYQVSLSSDGKNYTELAKRENHFGSGGVLSPPWTIACAKRARYVKVEAHKYLALSELEVFAR